MPDISGIMVDQMKGCLINFKKVQGLIHPYSWTENGYDNLHNFGSMIGEKNNELIESIDQECRHFRKVKDTLQKNLIR